MARPLPTSPANGPSAWQPPARAQRLLRYRRGMAAFRKRTPRISVGSIFEKLWRLGPAAFVPKAIVVAVVADALLLAFILLRRTYRKRYFDKRDACVFKWRQNWDDLLSARVPYSVWRARILR